MNSDGIVPPPHDSGAGDTRESLARALGDLYAVRGMVGRGGFAEVFEVWDNELHRRLAVKVLRPDLAWTPGMLSRFRQEARAVARLSHPNILPIHFVGQAEGLVYYAMPYVEGRSLGDLLRATPSPMPPQKALAIVIPVLEALQHAHERGLVHRDIKPDNVMLDSTTARPMLVDFGIVKQLDGESGHTQTGFVIGSPRYMSPEQALGQTDIDGRSDLYAVGAMLFQMLTGTPPFEGETSQKIVAQHISEPPPVASERQPGVPKSLSAVIVKLMSKSPDDRYRSAAEAAGALSGGRVETAAASLHSDITIGRGPGTDAPTEVVETGETRSAARSRGRPRRLVVPFGIGAVAVLGAVWGILSWRSPVLVLENRLVEPVDVTVNGGQALRVASGEEASIKVDRGRPMLAHWTLVPPRTASGVPMGRAIQGTVVESDPQGTVRSATGSWPVDSAYFAPLITNATDRPLAVIVNYGLTGSVRCACLIPPGATRVSIGYYLLYANSTVRGEDANGLSATFENLGPEVDRLSGIVGLRFETGDLRD